MKVRLLFIALLGMVVLVGASALAQNDVLTFGVTAEAETLDRTSASITTRGGRSTIAMTAWWSM